MLKKLKNAKKNFNNYLFIIIYMNKRDTINQNDLSQKILPFLMIFPQIPSF